MCSEKDPQRGWLQFLILRVVCETPSYGYEIIKKIDEMSHGRHTIKTGTMYTTLRRMENSGLLSSIWEKNQDAPDKRVYEPTAKGEEFLKKWFENLIESKAIIDSMIEFYNKKFGGK